MRWLSLRWGANIWCPRSRRGCQRTWEGSWFCTQGYSQKRYQERRGFQNYNINVVILHEITHPYQAKISGKFWDGKRTKLRRPFLSQQVLSIRHTWLVTLGTWRNGARLDPFVPTQYGNLCFWLNLSAHAIPCCSSLTNIIHMPKLPFNPTHALWILLGGNCPGFTWGEMSIMVSYPQILTIMM